MLCSRRVLYVFGRLPLAVSVDIASAMWALQTQPAALALFNKRSLYSTGVDESCSGRRMF